MERVRRKKPLFTMKQICEMNGVEYDTICSSDDVKINDNDIVMEYILCAAIALHVEDNESPIIIGGYRHGNCFDTAIKLGWTERITQEKQGFITSAGRFVGREEAKEIARNAGQLIRESGFKKLISEDIY